MAPWYVTYGSKHSGPALSWSCLLIYTAQKILFTVTNYKIATAPPANALATAPAATVDLAPYVFLSLFPLHKQHRKRRITLTLFCSTKFIYDDTLSALDPYTQPDPMDLSDNNEPTTST